MLLERDRNLRFGKSKSEIETSIRSIIPQDTAFTHWAKLANRENGSLMGYSFYDHEPVTEGVDKLNMIPTYSSDIAAFLEERYPEIVVKKPDGKNWEKVWQIEGYQLSDGTFLMALLKYIPSQKRLN